MTTCPRSTRSQLIRLLIGAIFFLCAPNALAESTAVFRGVPSVKISEGGVERVEEKLAHKDAVNLVCVISNIDGRFYWASRENKELFRYDGPAFITFVAVDGAGYIRVVKPTAKDAASLLGKTEESFDYVEHLLTGLRSVTYYGKSE